MFIGIMGMLGGIGCIIWLIVASIKKQNKKPALIGVGICVVLFIVGLIISPTPPPKDESKPTTETTEESVMTETTTESTTAQTMDTTTASTTEQTTTATVDPRQAEYDNEQQQKNSMIEMVKKQVDEKDFVDLIYNKNTNFISITIRGSENLTHNMTVSQMHYDIEKILKELSKLDYANDANVSIAVKYPLVDQYGNTEDAFVIKSKYNSDTRKKINWELFLTDNIPNIADDWWEHNALKK